MKEEYLNRFIQSFDYLKSNGVFHTITEASMMCDIKQPHLSSMLKGDIRRLTTGNLKRFVNAFSDYINEEWLLTGEGEMAKRSRNMRPHYDAKASAGFMDGISDGKMSAEFRALVAPLLNYDFSIVVSGDSMLPRIENDDTLLCRVSSDRLNPPIGKICVIDTKDGIVVKVIKNASNDSLTLHSLNPDYRDYDIDLNSILGIAEVVGLVRSFD